MKGDLEALERGRLFQGFSKPRLLVLALHYMHGHHRSITKKGSLSCQCHTELLQRPHMYLQKLQISLNLISNFVRFHKHQWFIQFIKGQIEF